jgi:uncharacterized membrane protein (UPF0127 family)
MFFRSVYFPIMTPFGNLCHSNLLARQDFVTRTLLALLLLMAVFGAAQAADPAEIALFSQSARHVFKVEIAATPEARNLGLMFRRELAPDGGMLFDFKQTQPVSMWMRNTLIPLDMLFIAENGRVVNIAERAVPGSLTSITSAEPVRYVLEVAGGTASRIGLKAGDRAQLPAPPSR